MRQVARELTFADEGLLNSCRYLIHDRDAKFCEGFRSILKDSGIKCVKLPARSPNLNAFAERWVQSARRECLDRLIFFGVRSLRYALTNFVDHYHLERNHQGLGGQLIEQPDTVPGRGEIECRKRLGGLLKYYHRNTA